MMDLTLRNCNNIDNGFIQIETGRLNIKYAANGTGKSTIAKALNLKAKNEEFTVLLPFKYQGADSKANAPSVSLSSEIRSIAVFDENYINTYVFKKDELLEKSFEIFVKTEQYEKHMAEIDGMVDNIRKTFKNDEKLETFISDLDEFIGSFGNAKNTISKSGNLGKSIGIGNKLENVPDALTAYSPYLHATGTNIKWLKWQSEGNDYLDIADKCPYCVSKITTPKETILKVSEEFESKYLAALLKVIEVFEGLKEYFSEETRSRIEIITKSAVGISQEQKDFLMRLKEEVITLREKLLRLKFIGFDSLKDVDRVVDVLRQNIIDMNFFPQLNSDYTKEKIEQINASIQQVIDTAGKLQGQINMQKTEIQRTIQKNSNEINGFLESAGYNYQVSIITGSNQSYRLILSYKGQQESISDTKGHLSYGERNAFALVLFMYQTLKQNAELIILDDPISSFDKNKKFAIMEMLFRGATSFAGKTVLMLTHDFEPVIDAIYNLPHIFCPVPKAYFLSNIFGQLNEQPITKGEIQSCISICQANIINSSDIIHKLIYLRRLLEINNEKALAWELASNVFHKNREIPQIKDNTTNLMRDMTLLEIGQATEEIKNYIPEFDYVAVYSRIGNAQEMIKLYKDSLSGYEKVQIYRILHDGVLDTGSPLKKYIDETFHVQNDYLFQLNPRNYQIVPHYILQCCDNNIDIMEAAIS